MTGQYDPNPVDTIGQLIAQGMALVPGLRRGRPHRQVRDVRVPSVTVRTTTRTPDSTPAPRRRGGTLTSFAAARAVVEDLLSGRAAAGPVCASHSLADPQGGSVSWSRDSQEAVANRNANPRPRHEEGGHKRECCKTWADKLAMHRLVLPERSFVVRRMICQRRREGVGAGNRQGGSVTEKLS